MYATSLELLVKAVKLANSAHLALIVSVKPVWYRLNCLVQAETSVCLI